VVASRNTDAQGRKLKNPYPLNALINCSVSEVALQGEQIGKQVEVAGVRAMELIVSTFVKAPVEVVFEVLRDVESYPKMFAYVKELHVLWSSEDGNELVADILEDMFGFLRWVRSKFIFKPPSWMEVRQLSGPFKSAVGWFEVKREGDGTLLKHGAIIEASGLVKAFGMLMLESGEAEARMRKEVAAIKRHAEMLAKTRKGENKRCVSKRGG
jgi:carbon monoxide dehydrogenase subunit G